MNLVNIKNFKAFKIKLPAATKLQELLEPVLFKEIGDNDFKRAGFINHPVTEELVPTFEGGFSLTLRFDSRILPKPIILKEAAKRIAKLENEQYRKLKRSEKNTIISEMAIELCPKAFVKTAIISAYYHTDSETLFITTTSDELAQSLLHGLVHAIGSVVSKTLHVSDVKHGLTTRLINYLHNHDTPFSGFTFGNVVQLSRVGDNKETVKYDGREVEVIDNLLNDLQNGFTVDNMTLSYNGINFRLTDRFYFNQISFDEKNEKLSDEISVYEQWQHESSIKILLIVDMLNKLTTELSIND